MYLKNMAFLFLCGVSSYSMAQTAAVPAQAQPAVQPQATAQSQVTAQPGNAQPPTATATNPQPTSQISDSMKSPLQKGYEFDSGNFIRQVGNRTFAKISRDKEVELPRPQFAIEFQKYPNYKTDPVQRRALLALTSERYVREYENIYLLSRGIGMEHSPFKWALDYVLMTIEQDPVDKLAADIFPPARLRRRLDDLAITTDRSNVISYIKDIAELKRKNALFEQELNEIKKKIK